MEVLGLIPARGGSKGVIRKNIKLLAGEPLIAYTIREGLKSKYINRLIVSTDDKDIADIARKYGAEVPFMRPPELALDHVTDLPVFQHCLRWLGDHQQYCPDIVVHLRPTAPLRRVDHIDQCIQLLINSPNADSVRSVCVAPKNPLKMWKIENNTLIPFIPESISGIKEAYNLPRQELPPAYVQNGSVDVIRIKTILEKKSMTGDVIIPFIMEESESVNIDSEIDFLVAEQLIKKYRG
nr:acylneuraminate cytidylyltransferase family protein [Desulfobacterales bacterium]